LLSLNFLLFFDVVCQAISWLWSAFKCTLCFLHIVSCRIVFYRMNTAVSAIRISDKERSFV